MNVKSVKKRFFRQDKKTHEEKNFQCTYCYNKFSSKFNVERHVKLNHTLVISGQGKIITEEKVKAAKL